VILTPMHKSCTDCPTFFLTTIVRHFPLSVRRSFGQPADCGHNTTVRERTGSGGRELSDKMMALLWAGDTTQHRDCAQSSRFELEVP
jgi:hypothetical protein